jgi:hypothetical protein
MAQPRHPLWHRWCLAILGVLLATAFGCAADSSSQPFTTDPLSAWNDGSPKNAILDFVERVKREGSSEFVPAAERIATFDNDGTLWSEQPFYFQFAFALDRVRALAAQHPEWKAHQPFKAVLEADTKALLQSGEKGLAEIIMTTHTGMSTDEFSAAVAGWLKTSQHPRFKRPYTDLVYEPMLQLLRYLREGTSFATKFQMEPDGKPVLLREPKIDFVDDGPGKPVAIQKFIGRRPILAFGNSDGDQQMLEWTAAGSGARFIGLIHHTDAEREWAYDRDSRIGRLDKALDEANKRGWQVIDMRQHWKVIYPFQKTLNPS